MSEFALSDEYKQHLRNTEFPIRDAIYNWLIVKHAKKNKPWTTTGFFSDKIFWSAALDQAWPWVPTLLFIYFVYFIATFFYDHYGIFRAICVLTVMCIIRINALVRQTSYTNRLLKERL